MHEVFHGNRKLYRMLKTLWSHLTAVGDKNYKWIKFANTKLLQPFWESYNTTDNIQIVSDIFISIKFFFFKKSSNSLQLEIAFKFA